MCVRVRAHTHVSRVFQPLGTWPEAILDSHSIPPFLFSTKDVFLKDLARIASCSGKW